MAPLNCTTPACLKGSFAKSGKMNGAHKLKATFHRHLQVMTDAQTTLVHKGERYKLLRSIGVN
jgi:hypothetical protein